MHEPWRILVLTLPDGSAAPTRVWLPPLPGHVGERDGVSPDGHAVELPVQRGTDRRRSATGAPPADLPRDVG